MKYPDEIKIRAYELYIQSYPIRNIISVLGSEFPGTEVNSRTIQNWANNDKWSESRALTRVSAFNEVTEEKIRSMTDLMRQYMQTYNDIISKGEKELKYLPFETAEGASKAVNDSIQGFTKMAKGIIQIKFVEDVVNVLKEEIEDEQILKRIYIKLQKVAQEYS